MVTGFEKDVFSYYATALVFGKRGYRIDEFKQYTLPVFNKVDIHFTEYQGLNVNNIMDISRTLTVKSGFLFRTTNTALSSGTSETISFFDLERHKSCSDSLFTNSEFRYLQKDWNQMAREKIRTLGNMIRAVYSGSIIDMPILMVDFPKIVHQLLENPELYFDDYKKAV